MKSLKHDVSRISLPPMPQKVSRTEKRSRPHSLAFAYYAGDDEVLTDSDQTDLDRAAYQQWCVNGDHDDFDC